MRKEDYVELVKGHAIDFFLTVVEEDIRKAQTVEDICKILKRFANAVCIASSVCESLCDFDLKGAKEDE